MAVSVLSIGLVAVSEVWVASARQQKLAQLEWIAAQYVRAIGSYRGAIIGAEQVYPSSLEDLLEDRRFAVPRRHLRQIYFNPFTGKNDWIPVRSSDGRVLGITVSFPSGSGLVSREIVFVPGVGEP